MFKAIRSSVVSVEPGKVVQVFPTKNCLVESEPLSQIGDIDKKRDCIVVSLESGPNNTIIDYVFNIEGSQDLLLLLMGSLCATGDPLALTLRDALPKSIEDLKES